MKCDLCDSLIMILSSIFRNTFPKTIGFFNVPSTNTKFYIVIFRASLYVLWKDCQVKKLKMRL